MAPYDEYVLVEEMTDDGEKTLLEIYRECGREDIELILLGYDEIDEEEKELIIGRIETIVEKGIDQFITYEELVKGIKII